MLGVFPIKCSHSIKTIKIPVKSVIFISSVPKIEYCSSYPALIVELKWNQNAQTAVMQIKDKKYPSSILDYTGEILLVGINYDKTSKEHQCLIEKYEKE